MDQRQVGCWARFDQIGAGRTCRCRGPCSGGATCGSLKRNQLDMIIYGRSFRGYISGRARRLLAGVLMSLNDPQWGRRGGNQGPPGLDELMRNFNQKLGSLFGRKGGGNGKLPGGPGLAQFGGGAGILLALIVLVWLASGFYIVDASQRGLVLRFGRYV